MKTSPAQFVRQVRQEIRKVVWPKKKEVGIGTMLVLVMVIIMSLFFLVVDQMISWAVQWILG